MSPQRLDSTPYRQVGQVLLESGVINQRNLDDALEEQSRTGGRLGMLLMLRGVITRLELYTSIARQLDLPFVDLIADPPDSSLMARVDAKKHADRDWVPYRWKDSTLVLAISEPPTEQMVREAKSEFGAEALDFVVTTDWDLDVAVTRHCRAQLLFSAAEELATRSPERSAKGKPVPWQRVFSVVAGISLVLGLLLRPSSTLIFMLAVINVYFFLAILFKVVTTLLGLVRQHDAHIVEERLREAGLSPYHEVNEIDLPMYTILVPVFHESNVVEMVLDHLGKLDWPKSKLQVLILTEEIDTATIEACKAARPPEYVRIVVVPEGSPQTKPRACNLGLLFALGDYLVIYDAEDRPDPDQLRLAHAAFEADREEVDQARPLACVQAALNYFNWDANLLTRMFTLEYSSWFDGMLHGMVAWRMPIPLGGTSNHFRTDRLREMGGWDPYNVTEDADLGMRASAAGYRVGTIESTTWEEACAHVPAFIRQRTRWIKGYIITALVDARYPIQFARSAGWRSMVTLIGLIAGTPFAFLAYPVVWGITIAVYLGFETTQFQLPQWVALLATINAIGGNLAILALSATTGAVRHGWRISGYALLNPFYWILHAIAAWRALFQVFFAPFHWEKTPHGLTLGQAENAEVT